MLQVKEALKYPRDIPKPDKNYIFLIPKEGTVFDYRYIKEVGWNKTKYYNWIVNIFKNITSEFLG